MDVRILIQQIWCRWIQKCTIYLNRTILAVVIVVWNSENSYFWSASWITLKTHERFMVNHPCCQVCRLKLQLWAKPCRIWGLDWTGTRVGRYPALIDFRANFLFPMVLEEYLPPVVIPQVDIPPKDLRELLLVQFKTHFGSTRLSDQMPDQKH